MSKGERGWKGARRRGKGRAGQAVVHAFGIAGASSAPGALKLEFPSHAGPHHFTHRLAAAVVV